SRRRRRSFWPRRTRRRAGSRAPAGRPKTQCERPSPRGGPLPRANVHTTKGLGYPDMSGLRTVHVSATWGVLASVVMAAVAAASSIHGPLTVPARVAAARAAANPYPGQAGSMPGRHGHPTGAVTDAIVYLEHVPADAESVLAKLHSHPQLAQKDQAFV